MLNNSTKFRQQLFEAEEMTPALRDAYRRELDVILHDTLTPWKPAGDVVPAVLASWRFW